MRLKLLITLSILAINKLSVAQDTLNLKAQARVYNDSIVLKWAPKTAKQFYLFLNNKVVVQHRTENSAYTTIANLTPQKIENWNQYLNNKNTHAQMAAGCVSNIQKIFTTKELILEKQIENSKTAQFLYANLLLSSDFNQQIGNILAMRYTHKNFVKEQYNYYKIFVEDSKNLVTDTVFIAIFPSPAFKADTLPPPNFQPKEKSIVLAWPANTKYSGYFIEKSAMGKNNFKVLNATPLLVPGLKSGIREIIITDSVPANYVYYEYRIYAVDAFGNSTQKSPVTYGYAKDLTPPLPPPPIRFTRLNDTTLRLAWTRINRLDNEYQLGISINHESEGLFTPLTPDGLPLTDTSFIYVGSSQNRNCYFALSLYDSAGNSSFTKGFYQLPDRKPPATPKNAKAVVDKKGVVTITWDMNMEDDFKGYLIYSANDTNAEFSGIVNRPQIDTFYKDKLSLKMLNPKVYYRIVAVDRNFNKSPATKNIVVLRPDTLRPVAPVFKSYLCTDTSINLVWAPSSSYDVAKQYLVKTNIKTKKSETIPLNLYDTVYNDKAVTPELYYRYAIYAEDENKNTSLTGNVLDLKTYKKLYRAPIKIVVAKYNKSQKQVDLTWRCDEKVVKSFEIYKGKSMDQVSFYTSTGKPELKFTDKKIVPNTTYYYAVKARFTDGTMTILSQSVEVTTTE
jgi:hypothetical protein